MSKSLCIILYLQACAKTCDFVCSQLTSIQDSLDGKNLESVLTEFGTRFHRQLFEHLQQFQYTSIGKHYLFYRLVSLWLFFFCFSHFWVANQRLCLCGQQTVTKSAARVAERGGGGSRNAPRDDSFHPHPLCKKRVMFPMFVPTRGC